MARMTEFGGSGSTKKAAMYAKKAMKYAKKALECLDVDDFDDYDELDERYDDGIDRGDWDHDMPPMARRMRRR